MVSQSKVNKKRLSFPRFSLFQPKRAFCERRTCSRKERKNNTKKSRNERSKRLDKDPNLLPYFLYQGGAREKMTLVNICISKNIY